MMQENKRKESRCYCINFRRAANTLTKYYDHAFTPIGLTTNQFSLLVSIDSLEACNKSKLAQYARLDRTTIIRSLHLLQEKHLIEEVAGKNKRNNIVQLTTAGEAAIKKGWGIWEQVQNKVVGAIGEENLPMLKQLLDKIESLEPE